MGASGPTRAREGLFGDGSDGAVTLGANTTLARDMFYTTLVVGAFTLTTAGFRIFAQTSVTVPAGGVITHSGGNASGSTAGTGPALGSTANGSAGATGGTGVGAAGTSVTGALGGAGGAGGAGAPNAGGAATTATAPAANRGGARARPQSTLGLHLDVASGVTTLNGGASGSAGGGDGVNAGGGGGGSGGTLAIASPTISVADAGGIRANGGNGGAGVAGNTGGGGGGGGGCVLLTYRERVGAGTVTAAAGTGGAAAGTGVAGAAGAAGTVIEVTL